MIEVPDLLGRIQFTRQTLLGLKIVSFKAAAFNFQNDPSIILANRLGMAQDRVEKNLRETK